MVQKAMATQSKQNKEQSAETEAPAAPSSSPPKAMPPISANIPTLRTRSSSGGVTNNNSNQTAVESQSLLKPVVQIPNTILEQNLVIPISTNSALSITPTNGAVAAGNNRRNSRTKDGLIAEDTTTRGKTTTTTPVKPINVPVKDPNQASPPKVSWMWNPGDLSRESHLPFNPPAVIDDSAASLLSRIPKSLTVIPQQKLRVNPE